MIIEPKQKQTKQQRKLSAEQELEMLEQDAQLMVLLDRLESGESLGGGLQKYVDEKLDRIEVLMKQLGLFEEEAEVEAPAPVAKKKSNSEDDLLSQFEDVDLNDFNEFKD